MSSIIVSSTLDFEPGARDGLLEQAAPLMTASSQEPGCIQYMIVADPLSSTRIRIFEHWDNMEALETHVASPHVQAFVKAIAAEKPRDFSVKSYEATEFERRTPLASA